MEPTRTPGDLSHTKVPFEAVQKARENPSQWIPIPGRYVANPTTWPSDVRKGKLAYLGGISEAWDAYTSLDSSVPPVDGKRYYHHWIAYLGPR